MLKNVRDLMKEDAAREPPWALPAYMCRTGQKVSGNPQGTPREYGMLEAYHSRCKPAYRQGGQLCAEVSVFFFSILFATLYKELFPVGAIGRLESRNGKKR